MKLTALIFLILFSGCDAYYAKKKLEREMDSQEEKLRKLDQSLNEQFSKISSDRKDTIDSNSIINDTIILKYEWIYGIFKSIL